MRIQLPCVVMLHCTYHINPLHLLVLLALHDRVFHIWREVKFLHFSSLKTVQHVILMQV